MRGTAMTTRPPVSFWRVFAFAWTLLSLLSIAWSMATPIAAAPDEPAHLVKAASVVRGQLVGAQGDRGQIVQVPAYIAFTHSQTCFAYQPDVTADCMPEFEGDPAALSTTSTTAGLYNPVYYLLVGWPSLIIPDGTGIVAMRIVSGILSSLFLALATALIAGWSRRLLPVVGLAVAITPMVLFLGGTVNPNSFEVSATLATFVGMLTILRSPDDAHLARNATIVFGAAAIGVNTRGLSPLWIAIALFVPFILAPKGRILALVRRRSVQWTIAGVALATIGAVGWLLGSSSLTAGLAAPDDNQGEAGVGTPPLIGFVWTLFATFRYALGMVGQFGWLDTPTTEFAYFAWSVVAGGILVLGLIVLHGRRLVFSIVLLSAAVLLPAIVQAAYVTGGGVVWQGRYLLPLFVCLVVGISTVLSDRVQLDRRSRSTTAVLILIALGIAQFQSFATALRRYSVGLGAGWDRMLDPAWSPPGGIPLWIVAYAGLLVIAGLAAYRFAVGAGDVSAARQPGAVDDEADDRSGEDGELHALDETERKDHDGDRYAGRGEPAR